MKTRVRAISIVLSLIFRQTGWLRRRFLWDASSMAAPAAVLVLLPLIAGFIGGTKGVVSFVSHSFYTHSGPQRDLRKTAGIWAALCLAA